MNAPLKLTRSECAEIVKQAEAEEATWRQLLIYGEEIALMPSGGCHWYSGNAAYESLEVAAVAIREFKIEELQRGLKTYQDIVDRFNRGEGKFDEYFTPERIEHFRELVVQYPKTIATLEDGKYLVVCETCGYPSSTCDYLDFDNPPKCECGNDMRYG